MNVAESVMCLSNRNLDIISMRKVFHMRTPFSDFFINRFVYFLHMQHLSLPVSCRYFNFSLKIHKYFKFIVYQDSSEIKVTPIPLFWETIKNE